MSNAPQQTPTFEAEGLIPHKPPIRMVDRLLEYNDGQSGVAEAVVTDVWPVLDSDDIVDPCAMTELVAQAYACVKGYEILLHGLTFDEGYLVGIQKFDIVEDECARLGDTLRICVQTAGILAGFAVVQGEVYKGDTLLAQGKIKVWTPAGDELAKKLGL